ncbi:hypothetical protein EUZ85_27330 [Hahella sp. KA22]|uniref:hypothetical protein n=1 Tax=Hahella sp. KA22 TaxID=1628392 RepID=UPI000FDEE409|nr:hypothetical protein [Hahella sp. KA22]AZZ94231.1 hypothetical protein ENC22_24745 [Hahella sp. KA22]QAY57605.1 hypothetical protein EUZ85_27330 [Hahella sp. KA22]
MMEKISNLNEFPDFLLERIRRIMREDKFSAYRYLESVVDESQRRYLMAFFRDVIGGKVEAAEWRRANCRVISISVESMLRTPVKEWPLIDRGDGIFIQIMPNLSYDDADTVAGSLALYDESLSYRSENVRFTMRYREFSPVFVNDVVASSRRYIAYRFYRCFLVENDAFLKSATVEDMVELAYPGFSMDSLSIDARVALTGLLAEVNSSEYKINYTPGFWGKDEVYQ